MNLRCDEHGLLSLRCKHQELAQPLLGKTLMAVGFFHVAVGLGMIVHG